MHSFARSGWTLAGMFAVLVLWVGCSDNPVDHDNGSDHAEAVRVELRLDEQLLYGYDATDGTVSCDASPCELHLTQGGAGASITADLLFLDEEGEIIAAAELEEDFSVRVEVTDGDVAMAAVLSDDDRHRLQVSAVGAGQAIIRISLMHGSHADFSTPPADDARALVVRVEG